MFDPNQGTFKPVPALFLGSKTCVQSEAKMRFLLLALVGVATVLGTPARAQNYPWCAQYSGRALGGAQNCGFVSFAQCMATVSGIGGFCVQNTLYQPPPARARKKKSH
jgi:uncharacterized protein DUF3551